MVRLISCEFLVGGWSGSCMVRACCSMVWWSIGGPGLGVWTGGVGEAGGVGGGAVLGGQ